LGIGDWGLGIGDWGLGAIPNPQSPIPNPHFNLIDQVLFPFNIILKNINYVNQILIIYSNSKPNIDCLI